MVVRLARSAHRPLSGERGNANPIAEANMSRLSSSIQAQAEWRRAKAEEYPDDERNARSVAELEELAFHVMDLEKAGDARVRYLTEYHLAEGVSLGGEETRRELSRWGFHHQAVTEGARDQFVSQLCALAAQDAFEFLRDNRASFTTDQVLELAEQYGLTEGDVALALTNSWPPPLHFVQLYASADNVAVLIEKAE
jgi:hypothetical protein